MSHVIEVSHSDLSSSWPLFVCLSSSTQKRGAKCQCFALAPQNLFVVLVQLVIKCFCLLALDFVPGSKLNLRVKLKLFAGRYQFFSVIQLQFFTRTFVLPSLHSCSSRARHKHQSSTEVVELHERSHTLQFLTQTFVLHGFDLCSWPAWHKFKWGRGWLVCMGLLNFRRRSTGMSYPINCVSQR